MKTIRLFLTLVLLTLVGNAFADELKVEPFTMQPGETKEVEVELLNTDSPYILLELWMTLPEGISVAKDEDGEYLAELNSTRVAKSHTLDIQEQESGKYKMLLWSSKNAQLSGTSGTIFTMTLTASADMANGTYQGHFNGQMFVKPDKSPYYPADVSFDITVGDAEPPLSGYQLFCNDMKAYLGSNSPMLEVCLTNEDQVRFCQFDLTLPTGVTVALNQKGKLDATMTERGEDFSISAKQLPSGSYRFVLSSLDGDSFTGNEGVLVNIRLAFSEDLQAGDYAVRLSNIELSLPDGNDLVVVRPADTVSLLTIFDYMPGDVNNDGKVTVTDAGLTINYILEQVPSTFIFPAADMYQDGLITVTDVGYIINTILDSEYNVRPRAPRRQESADRIQVPTVTVKSGESVELAIEFDATTANYMGWQCDMTLSEGLTLKLDNAGKPEATLGERFDMTEHKLSTGVTAAGGYRFIATSFERDAIPTGSGTLFTVTLQADEMLAPGNYEGRLSAIEFNTIDNQRLLFDDLTFTVTVAPEGIKGDVNGDGAVDIADVVAVYNIMAGNNSNGYNGDVNKDGATDIADVVAIYNIMAGGK